MNKMNYRRRSSEITMFGNALPIGNKKFKNTKSHTTHAEHQMQMQNDNSNASKKKSSMADQTNTQTSKQRSGVHVNKNGTKFKRPKEETKPIAVVPKGGNKYMQDSQRLADNIQGMFGYQVNTGAPTSYNDAPQTTVYRKWNEKALQPALANTGTTININNVTTEVRQLDIDFKESIATRPYSSQWASVVKLVKQKIQEGTGGSFQSAQNVTTLNLTEYHHNVINAYDLLIQLESILSWNPTQDEDLDACRKYLVSDAFTVANFDKRKELRTCLETHKLPKPIIDYLRYMREPKLRNLTPESTKLSFYSAPIISLLDGLLNPDADPGALLAFDNAVLDAIALVSGGALSTGVIVSEVNPNLPVLFGKYCESMDYVPIRWNWENMSNKAVFDADWLDIYNNRPYLYKQNNSFTRYPSFPSDTLIYAATRDLEPEALILSSLGKLRTVGSSEIGGLPLEGVLAVNQTGVQQINANIFYMYFPPGGVDKPRFRGIERFYEFRSDTVHTFDTVLGAGISFPKCEAVRIYDPSDNNISQAQEVSFRSLFRIVSD